MALTIFRDRMSINDVPQAMLICYQCHCQTGIVDADELKHLAVEPAPPTVCFECEDKRKIELKNRYSRKANIRQFVNDEITPSYTENAI